MKQVLITIYFSVFSFVAFGQAFSPLQNDTLRESSTSLIEVEPDVFVYLEFTQKSYYYFDPFTFPYSFMDTVLYNQWLAQSDSAVGKIIRIDKNNYTTNEFLIKTKPNEDHVVNFLGQHLVLKDGYLYFVDQRFDLPFNPTIFADWNQKLLLTLYKLDKNLNLISKTPLQDSILNQEELFKVYPDFIIKDNGNIVLRASFGKPNTTASKPRIVEYNGQSGLIKNVNLDNNINRPFLSALIELPNNYYLGASPSRLSYIDTNLDVLHFEFQFPLDSFKVHPNSASRLFKFGNRYFQLGTMINTYDPNLTKMYNTIYSINYSPTSCTLDSVVIDQIPQAVSYLFLPPIENNNFADAKYPTYCYMAFNTSYSHTTGNGPSDTSSIYVTCADTNGTVKWNKLVGGDASYELTCVSATADSGCVIMAVRSDNSIYPNGYYSLDIYYTKLDKNGNVQPNYIPVSNQFKKLPVYNSLVVYPNPAIDKLYIQGQEIATYSLYNMQGSVIRSARFNGFIDISSIAKGTYMIKAKDKEDRYYWAKWVKL